MDDVAAVQNLEENFDVAPDINGFIVVPNNYESGDDDIFAPNKMKMSQVTQARTIWIMLSMLWKMLSKKVENY